MKQYLKGLISMDLSIIILNYNTKNLTQDCIKSIKNSRPKVSYEIIVVDNASTEKFPKSNNYKLISNSTNLGFAKANNQGMKIAKGKYILLLNSDTIIKDKAIDRLYEFSLKQNDAGAVVPQLLNTDGSIQPSCFQLPSITLAIKQYFFGQKNLLDKYIPTNNTVDAAVMAAFLITPASIKKVGYLNEKYFMYFEDLDYCKTIKNAGLKIYYLKEAQVIHIHGASGGKNELLIDSAKKYHGIVGYYIYTSILWIGQKWERFLKTLS